MNKRKVLIIALCVCLAAIAAIGSLAYFTDTANVQNTFKTSATLGDDVTADDLFSLSLTDAAKDNKGDDFDAKTETFSNILPGSVYNLEPTVENTGEYSQWVRVNVTLSNADKWKAALAVESYDFLKDMFVFTDENAAKLDSVNTAVSYSETDNSATVTYYLKDKLAKDAEATLFSSVKIPEALGAEGLAAISSFEVTVVADAIQSDNTGDSAKAAFTGFWS